MSLFQSKKIFLLGFLVVLLFAVPLTVYLTRESQQITSQATPATTLSFVPLTKTVNVGETASFDVMMTPGSNQVSFVKLTLTYDGTKFTVDPAKDIGIAPNVVFTVLAGPTFSNASSATATVSITLSVGENPSAVISGTTPTKLLTINLKAIAGTSGATTPVGIDRAQTQVLSIASGDQANEDVLMPGQPTSAIVTIGAGSAPGSGANKPPVCTSLVLDRSATGPAPWTVTFTVSGTGIENNIDKITVSYGDGQAGEITTSGGLGTKSVRAQIAHTYKNAGTYNATAQLSDAGKKLSDPVAACNVAITVTAASAGGQTGWPTGTGSGGVVAVPTQTPVVTVAPVVTIAPTIAPPGAGDKIIGIGMAGIMLAILGALLLAF